MERSVKAQILKDMSSKIILISGPRQAGKTWLSKSLAPDYDYLTYDDPGHRIRLRERSWDRQKPLVILDELHKMSEWKAYLKAVFDVDGIPPALVVTGSARLDAFRKVGDSLAGRFFAHRLHPFDVRELASQMEPDETLARILKVGGFPEPFLANDEVFYARWRRTHLDVILRQDLLDLVTITDILGIETLIELLRSRVGSPISYANLGADLQKDPKTIKVWLGLLENLHVIFAVRPWHRNIARAILKEPKYYFHDTGQVKTGGGARLENAVACSLRKELDFLEDTRGLECALHYLRNKEGKELDFAVVQAGRLSHCFEVKAGDSSRSPSFAAFGEAIQDAKRIQLVGSLSDGRTYPDGLEIRDAATYLADLDLLA
ncbi:MAG: ATP-binding protein [Rectinemataceae bacterium]